MSSALSIDAEEYVCDAEISQGMSCKLFSTSDNNSYSSVKPICFFSSSNSSMTCCIFWVLSNMNNILYSSVFSVKYEFSFVVVVSINDDGV